jgi:transcriptional regulator with XRE-family HTH domain
MQTRYHQGLKQEDLAARGGVLGWELSRGTLSEIGAQLHCVTDAELEVLAKALRLEIAALYPGKRGSRDGRR